MSIPALSYTIWFSQRVGSSALCRMLRSTGVAGNPGEWLNLSSDQSPFDLYHVETSTELREGIWRKGTLGGVFGLKYGPWEPKFTEVLSALAGPDESSSSKPLQIWESAFPNSHHIFMRRRDKVRLAVSWWKAIQSGEWHRERGADSSASRDIRYSFDAIDDLYRQSVERDALIGVVLADAESCLTIEYEDFLEDPARVVHSVLGHLGLSAPSEIQPPELEKLADALSDEWVHRYIEDRARLRQSEQKP